jgi:tyrosine phenol-lyase
MDVTAESVVAVRDKREHVHGLTLTYEPPVLRFFQARFAPVGAGSILTDQDADTLAGAIPG